MGNSRNHYRSMLGLALLTALLASTACGQAAGDGEESFTIGLVTNNPNGLRNVRGFVDGMTELGFRDGENVEYVFAAEPLTGDALDEEIGSMVDRGVDLIFTAGTPTGVAAYRITAGTDIPVVFGVIADPQAAGVIDDLRQPGGNMTGVKLGQDQDRRLELLLEIAPKTSRVFVPFNPDDAAAASAVGQIQEAAGPLGVELVLGPARTPDEVDRLLEDPPVLIDAVFLVPDSTVNAALDRIMAMARSAGLPVSGPSTAQVEDGALTTYGFIHEEAGAQAARIAGRVLRGIAPGDIPIEDAESFLAINLIAAEQIGLSVEDAILQQAEIILRPAVASS